jgi:hypothetical protein
VLPPRPPCGCASGGAMARDDLESLYDLVEARAAQHGISQRGLWKRVLTAILNGALGYEFSDEWIKAAEHPLSGDNKTRVAFSYEHWDKFLKGERIPGALRELEYSDLIGLGWTRQLMIPAAVFDEWLKVDQSGSHPKKPARGRRGPKPGTVSRYGEADRALFAEMDKLIPQAGSARAAALQLAWDGKISGDGTEESGAKRLERKYLQHKKLAPTKSH